MRNPFWRSCSLKANKWHIKCPLQTCSRHLGLHRLWRVPPGTPTHSQTIHSSHRITSCRRRQSYPNLAVMRSTNGTGVANLTKMGTNVYRCNYEETTNAQHKIPRTSNVTVLLYLFCTSLHSIFYFGKHRKKRCTVPWLLDQPRKFGIKLRSRAPGACCPGQNVLLSKMGNSRILEINN